MIDLCTIIANGAWIAGLALLLAVLSGSHWVASVERRTLRAVLARHSAQVGLNVGLALFCAGLAATARAWWEQALWALLAAVWVARVVYR